MHEHNQDNQDLSVKLTAYLMGELEASEAQEMERALAESAELRAEKAKLESVIGLVREHGAEDASLSDEARESILADAEGGKVLSFYERPLPKRMASAASVLLLVGTAGAIYIMGQVSSSTETEVMDLARKEGQAAIENRGLDTVEFIEEVSESEPALSEKQQQMADRAQTSPEPSVVIVGAAPAPALQEAEGGAKVKLGASGKFDKKALRAGSGGPGTPGPNTVIGLGGGGGGKAAGRFGERFGSSQKAANRSRVAQGSGTRTGAESFFFAAGELSGAQDLQMGLVLKDAETEESDFDGVITGRLIEGIDEDVDALDEERLNEIALEFQKREAEQRSQRIINSCKPFPNEEPAAMFFRFWGDNPFVHTSLDSQSTFGVDVDTASYTLARRYLTDGILPKKAQVRTEEFLNYFKPDIDAPTEGTFRIQTELAPSRFGGPDDKWMLRVTVRGKDVAREERQPLNLTFVVDVSGSMKQNGRLETVKHGLRLLTAQLDANDSVALVAYSNQARVVLPMTSAANRALIEEAIHGLQPGGGTNAEAGLKMGYAAASDLASEGRHHRVVLLSDGVANIGQTDQDRINADIKTYRDRGIYLNTIGVGMGNHNDTFLEQLANKGDGICNYIDDDKEARRALVENFTGAFEPIARDVKIQVEFEDGIVRRYRQIGYENRAIADADFRNDAVDAGEVGAGHQVTALYELELEPNAGLVKAPLATVRLRWKQPTGADRDPLEDSATESEQNAFMNEAVSWEGASYGFRRAICVAQFAELLRRSEHARTDSLDELIAESQRLEREHLAGTPGADDDFIEFLSILDKSRKVIINNLNKPSPLQDCVRRLQNRRYRHHQCFVILEEEGTVKELELEIAELETKVRELVEQETH